ncbi:MAG: hypothetical protein FJY11_10140, partial [Bacteroidetes bacterium]|nr:hypothetical protein [Bacteroidota bacterium]
MVKPITRILFVLIFFTAGCARDNQPIGGLKIPSRDLQAESGSEFMARIEGLPPAEREEEIFMAVSSGNIPAFLRKQVTLDAVFTDAEGKEHHVQYQVMPDYLAVGSDLDFCRIPMNPHTAQRLATLFGASLPTAGISDHIYENAEVKLAPFNYIPAGNANELVPKFRDHNEQIERQFSEAGGKRGQLTAGIKKDVILSAVISEKRDRVVIYGWHKPDGKPIQPVYSGHIDWYVDYSHGIRLVNDRVLVDGKPASLGAILQHPVLFRLFSNEDRRMEQSVYIRAGGLSFDSHL